MSKILPLITLATLRELKFHEVKTINDKSLMQRKVYLAHALGLDLGFDFKWTSQGPHSQELQRFQTLIPESYERIKDIEIMYPVKNVVEAVNSFELEAGSPEVKLPRTRWFNVLSVVAYKTAEAMDDIESIVNEINNPRPRYTYKQISKAYNLFTSTKTQLGF